MIDRRPLHRGRARRVGRRSVDSNSEIRRPPEALRFDEGRHRRGRASGRTIRPAGPASGGPQSSLASEQPFADSPLDDVGLEPARISAVDAKVTGPQDSLPPTSVVASPSKPRALRNGVWLSLGSLINQTATMLLFLAVARAAGPTAFGPVVAAIGLATIAVDLTDLGLSSRLLRDLSRKPSTLGLVRSAVEARAVTIFVVATAWILLSPVLARRIEMTSVWMLAGYTALFSAESLAIVPLKAAGRMRSVGLIIATDRVVATTTGLLLLLAGVRPTVALTISLATGAAAGCTLALVRWPAGQVRELIRTSNHGKLRDAWRGTFSFGITGLLTDLQLADAAIVQAFAGPTAAGLLAVPARLTGPIGTVSASFSAALFPSVAALEGNQRRQREELLSGAWLLVPLSLGLVLLWFAAPSLIPGLFGQAYEKSGQLLRLFLPGILLASINAPLASYLQARGDERYVAQVVAITVLSSFVALALLAARFGATGGPLTYLGLEVAVTASLLARIFRGSS
jgi:O-antigen/teichoic acid export membrane protein